MKARRTFLLSAAALVLAVAAIGLFAGTSGAQTTPPPATPSPFSHNLPPSGVVDLGCPECHGDPSIQSKGQNFYVPQSELSNSVHSSLTCISCHLQTQGVLHKDPAAEIEAARTSCKKCHDSEWQQWSTSSHAGGPADGKPDCVTCHGNHSIQPADNRLFVTEVANDKCAECHNQRGSDFFKNNYHGKESSLGNYSVAVCADCHTAHHELPPSNPDSSVSPQNRVATCRQCHPGANASFASIEIHVNADPIPSDPKLAAATIYFIIILSATFGLFGWHMVLGIRHTWRENHAAASVGTSEDEEEEV